MENSNNSTNAVKNYKPGTPGAILGNKRAKQQTIEELMCEQANQDNTAQGGLINQSLNSNVKKEPNGEGIKGILIQSNVRHSVIPLSSNLGAKRVKFKDHVD